MPKTATLVCLHCEAEYEYPKAQREYQLRTGKAVRTFCGRPCMNAYWTANGTKGQDEFTPFRALLQNSTTRGKEHSLTLEQMKTQWELQRGLCPYTGVQLILRGFSASTTQTTDPLRTASLDRKDNTLGYVAGNIQFVSMMANYARNRFTHEQMLDFCQAIAQNWKV